MVGEARKILFGVGGGELASRAQGSDGPAMAPPSWALGGLIGGLLAAAILTGTMLFMEMERSRQLETQFAAFDSAR